VSSMQTFSQYYDQIVNEGPPVYVDPSDTRASDMYNDMDPESSDKATRYGAVGKEHEDDTIQRINRVAEAIYNTLKMEQEDRQRAGEDVVSSEKWSNLKLRLIQLAIDEKVPATRAKFFMRVIVNSLKAAGIIQVNVKADKVMVDTPPEDRQEDVKAISQGVVQAKKKGLLSRLFSR